MTAMTRTSRRISTACHWLKNWTDDPIPGMRKVHESAVSAKFPAHQVNAIWHYYEEDREAILAGLGLRPKAERLSRSRQVSESAAA